MKMNKRIAAVVITAGMGIIATATPAFAHTFEISSECVDGNILWTVNPDYPQEGPVKVNQSSEVGLAVGTTVPDSGLTFEGDNSVTIKLKWEGDNFKKELSGTFEGVCETPTTTTTTTQPPVTTTTTQPPVTTTTQPPVVTTTTQTPTTVVVPPATDTPAPVAPVVEPVVPVVAAPAPITVLPHTGAASNLLAALGALILLSGLASIGFCKLIKARVN